MPRLSSLKLGLVTCIATNDFTGADDLVGVLGADRFSIGEFEAGSSFDVGIERPIAPGVTELTILEADVIEDDVLAAIDLTQDMDVDRVFSILTGAARYDVNFLVISEPD
jgi:hypothetical protein